MYLQAMTEDEIRKELEAETIDDFSDEEDLVDLGPSSNKGKRPISKQSSMEQASKKKKTLPERHTLHCQPF